MPIKENFLNRLNNAEILVIGASYMESDYNYWKQKDLNYIGFARTWGSNDEQVQFHEGNLLDFDWNDINVVDKLKSCLKNKVFQEIYIDRGTMQHIKYLDLILNYLFNNHLAADGKFYFPAYQEPTISGGIRFYQGISEKDYERLKSILPKSSLQEIESVELDRQSCITEISIYSVCKNPCKNSKSADSTKKKQKTLASSNDQQTNNSSSSSSSVNNTLLFTNLSSSKDVEIARQLQEHFNQEENDEEIARQLQLQFDQENYGGGSPSQYF